MAQGHKTLATVFHNEADTYTKVVAGFTIPVRVMFTEGQTLTGPQARALSAYYLERGASVANSNIDRGSWKDMADAEKLAKVTDYLSPTVSIERGVDSDIFGYSLLTLAAMDVLRELPQNAKVKELDEANARKALEKGAAKFLNSPEAVEAYEEPVRNAINAILAKRHEKRTRAAKGEGGVEIAF